MRATFEELFDVAVELSPAEREQFLDSSCGDDPALRREIDALLASEKAAGEYFDCLASRIARAASSELESAARPRTKIGPYRTLGVIGSGGMGVVYRAARIDGQFDQQVALKLLHLDMETPEIRARFLAERQLLARISHSQIAHLMDGGVTDEGRPYFVMELVEGRPITEYCREHGLQIEEILRLFLQVVEAVSYLHRNLIVHRDLKPSNILVDREGRVKLLDFGIAKLLSEEPAVGGRTRTGRQMMTPGYAAPEQMTGRPVTTATDVYGLGVLLYELLTGTRPHWRTGSQENSHIRDLPTAPSSLLRSSRGRPTIDEESPEKAASGTIVPASWRRIRGDLDTICLTALRPEPEARYPSAEQLGQDVERHLQGLPVQARTSTFGYRLGKLVRRQRRAIAVATGLLVLVAAGFVRERGLRDEAERARAEAVAVSDFLTEILVSADPRVAMGREVTVGEVLDQASARLESGEEFAGQPEVEAAVRLTVGNTYQALSRFEEAKSHLDRAVELFGGREGASVEALASIEALGVLHFRREEYGTATELARHVLELRTEALGEEHPETLEAMSLLANALWAQGLYDEVEPLDRKTVEIRRRVLGENHPDTLRSMNGLAATLFNSARYLDAAAIFRQVLAVQKRVLGDGHPDTLTSGNNLGACLMELCLYREAEEALRPVLEGRLRVLGEDDPLTWTTIHNLGAVLAPMGRWEEAEELLRRAAGRRREMTGDLRNYYFTRSYLADLVRDRGRHEEAEAIYLETLDEQRSRYGDEDSQTLKTAVGLADLRLRQGRLDEAESLLAEVTEALPGVVGSQHPDLFGARALLARLRNAQERPVEALELAEGVLTSAGPTYDPEHPLVLDTKAEKMLALRRLGRYQEAAALAAEVYHGSLNRLGPEHPRTLEARRLVEKPG